MLLLLYCQTLLFFRFDRGMVHVVVVVILSTFTVCGLIEEWFMFWLDILSTIFV
jgi:hypothetical protein